MENIINRDISWLYFNGRVLEEASRADVPLLERLKFMAIFSANLDEFYRVRIPILHGLRRLAKKKAFSATTESIIVYKQAKKIIKQQQKRFGSLLTESVVPALEREGIRFCYNKELPSALRETTYRYFQEVLVPQLQCIDVHAEAFFPENNVNYFMVSCAAGKVYIVSLRQTPRFFHQSYQQEDWVLFIDDIVKAFIHTRLPAENVRHIHSFKVTRDAHLLLYEGAEVDITAELERELSKRDFGLATRLLYPATMPSESLSTLLAITGLKRNSAIAGGSYHNLKDFFSFPIQRPDLLYPKQKEIDPLGPDQSIFDAIDNKDILIHTPYHSYEPVVRFFAEAAADPNVLSIATTIYRIAENSEIGAALVQAARNGKSVHVFVELKARFDESNNIHWAKRLTEAGAQISYSIPHLKVHAKIALIKRASGNGICSYTLLSTGNLNEETAKVYADHSLLSNNRYLAADLNKLFGFLRERTPKTDKDQLHFDRLLVAQFNLLESFKKQIDQEIAFARKGEPAHMIVKLNNLEDEEMIDKLYEASAAGVKIELIIRGICRLIPGVPTLSEHISVKQIVGRYLEHSRIFYFHNGGHEAIYIGSSDWMVRNLRHRIEVCVPVEDGDLQNQLKSYLQFQLLDERVTASPGTGTSGLCNGTKIQGLIRDWLESV